MRFHRSVVRVFVTITAAMVGPLMMAVAAHAQSLGLAQLLPDLILREIVLQSQTTAGFHAAHFSPIETGELTNPVVGIV